MPARQARAQTHQDGNRIARQARSLASQWFFALHGPRLLKKSQQGSLVLLVHAEFTAYAELRPNETVCESFDRTSLPARNVGGDSKSHRRLRGTVTVADRRILPGRQPRRPPEGSILPRSFPELRLSLVVL